MRLLILSELILACVLGMADRPYRLPDAGSVPQPMPRQAGFKLSPSTLFVIDADSPLVVLASPGKLVQVTAEPGPIRIRGVFVDGAGKVETRMFFGKHVYVLDASQSGVGEVIIVPVGAVAPTDRIPIEVTGTDPPRPDPGPQPPGPVTPAKLFVVVIEETEQGAAGRGAMFADKDLVARFAEKGHKWRIVDQDVVGPDGKPPEDVRQFLGEAKGKPLPRLSLVSIEDGRRVVRFAGDCPKTASELLALIQKHGG